MNSKFKYHSHNYPCRLCSGQLLWALFSLLTLWHFSKIWVIWIFTSPPDAWANLYLLLWVGELTLGNGVIQHNAAQLTNQPSLTLLPYFLHIPFLNAYEKRREIHITDFTQAVLYMTGKLCFQNGSPCTSLGTNCVWKAMIKKISKPCLL